MKKKIGYFWFYYKWYFLAAVFVVVILADFVWGKVASGESDGQVAFITMDYIPEEVQNRISLLLEDTWGDRNGDGEKKISVYQYHYNGDTDSAGNVNEFMASAVQLAADLENRDSAIYFTDCPEFLLNINDELKQFGVWNEIPVLSELGVEGMEFLSVLGWSTEEQALNDFLYK